MTLPRSPTTTPKGRLPTIVAQWVIRSCSCAAKSIGAEPHRERQEPVRLRDVAPALHQPGGLDDRLDARVGEHAERHPGREGGHRVRQAVMADLADDARAALVDDVRALRVEVQEAERDQVEQHDGGDDEDDEGDARVLTDAEDVEPRDRPDGREDDHVLGGGPHGEEGGPIVDRAHRRDGGGQDVVDHDRRDRHERGDRTEHEVGERVDAATADVVPLEHLRDLDHARREDAHEERGDGDEEDRPRPDEAVGLRRHVEDRRELVHQRDEPGGEPGEVPAPALREAEEPLALHEDGEQREQSDVQPEEGEEGHASGGLTTPPAGPPPRWPPRRCPRAPPPRSRR